MDRREKSAGLRKDKCKVSAGALLALASQRGSGSIASQSSLILWEVLKTIKERTSGLF